MCTHKMQQPTLVCYFWTFPHPPPVSSEACWKSISEHLVWLGPYSSTPTPAPHLTQSELGDRKKTEYIRKMASNVNTHLPRKVSFTSRDEHQSWAVKAPQWDGFILFLQRLLRFRFHVYSDDDVSSFCLPSAIERGGKWAFILEPDARTNEDWITPTRDFHLCHKNSPSSSRLTAVTFQM